jgi:hypothetical protein
MMSDSIYGNVVTTIQNPTKALLELAEKATTRGEHLFVVGDQKTPLDFSLSNSKYLSVEAQQLLKYKIVSNLPWNSYTRKMLGYLDAAKAGCRYIRETDDDNFPLDSFFLDFPQEWNVRAPHISGDWVNPYIYFSDEYIWPRGYPIELIESNREHQQQISLDYSEITIRNIGVVQGLADGAPDVDALYRLVYKNSGDFKFNDLQPLLIPKGTFAPFNSQVTTWNVELLPLMYLPHTCTFRMTDIWRSFIATHLMHRNGYDVVFTGPSAFQDRNEHNLLRDFTDEVPGYIGNGNLVSELQSVDMQGGTNNLGKDLVSIYSHLVSKNFFGEKELITLNAWLNDCEVL